MSKSKTKTRIPQQQRSIQTKKQIIDAAMKLFSEKGFHATNSKEIAKEAGVATGCFYSYFTDKKAVFIEALKIYFEEFGFIFQEHVAKLKNEHLDKKDFLKGLVMSILEAHHVFTDFHNELTVMYYSDPEILKLIDEFEKNSIQFTLEYLKEAQEQLKVTDLEAASVVVFRSVHSIVDAVVFYKKKELEQRLVEELVDMVIRYLFGDL